jgi:FAD/FMN-containing dehydrogenase
MRWHAIRPEASTSTSRVSGEENEALVKAGYGTNYDRLTKLKTKYDPTNLFRMNLNVPPA